MSASGKLSGLCNKANASRKLRTIKYVLYYLIDETDVSGLVSGLVYLLSWHVFVLEPNGIA